MDQFCLVSALHIQLKTSNPVKLDSLVLCTKTSFSVMGKTENIFDASLEFIWGCCNGAVFQRHMIN